MSTPILVRLYALRPSTFAIFAASLMLAACGVLAPPAPAPVLPEPPAREEPAVVVEPERPVVPRTTARPAPPARSRGATSADAVPRIERIATGFPNAPYTIKGVAYQPVNEDLPMKETGIASWYGAEFHRKVASTGERFDMYAMTAAHPTMPLPSYAIVRNLDNGRQVVVRVNDRGPFIGRRIIDLSYAAARKLGITGLGRVEVERLTHADIQTGAWKLLVPTQMAGAAGATPAHRADALSP